MLKRHKKNVILVFLTLKFCFSGPNCSKCNKKNTDSDVRGSQNSKTNLIFFSVCNEEKENNDFQMKINNNTNTKRLLGVSDIIGDHSYISKFPFREYFSKESPSATVDCECDDYEVTQIFGLTCFIDLINVKLRKTNKEIIVLPPLKNIKKYDSIHKIFEGDSICMHYNSFESRSDYLSNIAIYYLYSRRTRALATFLNYIDLTIEKCSNKSIDDAKVVLVCFTSSVSVRIVIFHGNKIDDIKKNFFSEENVLTTYRYLSANENQLLPEMISEEGLEKIWNEVVAAFSCNNLTNIEISDTDFPNTSGQIVSIPVNCEQFNIIFSEKFMAMLNEIFPYFESNIKC